jgi:hypothetical protein
MTHDYKLAYDIFEQTVNHGEYILAVESALKKQIPKKVIFQSDFEGLRYCPCCNVRFIGWGMKYCGECGQALDWSDTE